jgi:hypothetical protein
MGPRVGLDAMERDDYFATGNLTQAVQPVDRPYIDWYIPAQILHTYTVYWHYNNIIRQK